MAVENIAEIEQSLGIEAGKLQEMITSDEAHTIDLTSKVILDKPIYEERISNIKKESANAAIEMAVKAKRTELGLDFQGKNFDNLLTAFKTKIEAESTAEPEEKYKKLKTDFEGLQSVVQEKDNKINELTTTFAQKEKRSKIQSDVFKFIPDNVIVSKGTIMIEAEQKGFTFDEVEGKTVVKGADGEVIKNLTTFSPISLEEWMPTFVTPFIPKVEGGAGGGDKGGNSLAGSLEAFEKEAEKAGWNITQKNAEMLRRITAGTLKL